MPRIYSKLKDALMRAINPLAPGSYAEHDDPPSDDELQQFVDGLSPEQHRLLAGVIFAVSEGFVIDDAYFAETFMTDKQQVKH